MNLEQLNAPEKFIEAKIDDKIKLAFGGDNLSESVRAFELKHELMEIFKFE